MTAHVVIIHPENSPEEINVYLRETKEAAIQLAAAICARHPAMVAHVYKPSNTEDATVLDRLEVEYECNYTREEYM